jgi:hypothetical protein
MILSDGVYSTFYHKLGTSILFQRFICEGMTSDAMKLYIILQAGTTCLLWKEVFIKIRCAIVLCNLESSSGELEKRENVFFAINLTVYLN